MHTETTKKMLSDCNRVKLDGPPYADETSLKYKSSDFEYNAYSPLELISGLKSLSGKYKQQYQREKIRSTDRSSKIIETMLSDSWAVLPVGVLEGNIVYWHDLYTSCQGQVKAFAAYELRRLCSIYLEQSFKDIYKELVSKFPQHITVVNTRFCKKLLASLPETSNQKPVFEKVVPEIVFEPNK
jgi:hypothetical protein